VVAGRGGRRSDAGTTVLGVMSGGGAEKRGSRRRNEIASKAAVLLGARAHRRSRDQLQHLGNHNNGGIRQRRLRICMHGCMHGCCGGWHDGSELLLLRLHGCCCDACSRPPMRARSRTLRLLLLAAGRLWLNATVVAPACLQFTLSCLFHSRSSKKIRLWMG
jgi:hypothetical protein